jgi:hypothetical protein
MWEMAETLSRRLQELFPEIAVQQAAFMGRIGSGKEPHSRSLRLPLSGLKIKP